MFANVEFALRQEWDEAQSSLVWRMMTFEVYLRRMSMKGAGITWYVDFPP